MYNKKRERIGKLLNRVIGEIIKYCKWKKIDFEKMDFLLIVDDKSRIKIRNSFEAAAKIEDLITTKKAHSYVIVLDRKEETPVVGIRFGDDGVWHLEEKSK